MDAYSRTQLVHTLAAIVLPLNRTGKPLGLYSDFRYSMRALCSLEVPKPKNLL